MCRALLSPLPAPPSNVGSPLSEVWSWSLESRDSRLEEETPEGDEDDRDDEEAKEASSKESLWRRVEAVAPAPAPAPAAGEGVWKGRGIYPTEELVETRGCGCVCGCGRRVIFA